ncbi:MAG: hypothetical protein AAF548_15820 [Actinomycetota bacterium]
MAKRRRGGGRVTPKGTQPQGFVPKQRSDGECCTNCTPAPASSEN